MKKVLLSLAMLTMTIGALAQSEIPTSKFNADELNSATDTKRIAIRCTQESNYNTFYNGNGRSNLPWTESMIYEWEAAEDGTHYIKKAYHDDGDENIYLLNTNTKTFGTKTANNVAKFTALSVSGNIDNSGLHSDEDKTYWVRLALNPAKNTWFNFNGDIYNGGTGVWTVQHVMDMTGYCKITINIVKDGTTQATTQLAKSGSTITLPVFDGYEADVKTVTKDATDNQQVTVNYSIVKTLTPGDYYIYYTDDSNVKHYLQTTGTNNVTTTTENPVAYAVSNGAITGGQYSKAYFLLMNNLRISNTNANGTQIQTSTRDRTWDSQVFIQREQEGKCAIRLTNATTIDQWHGDYFIGKGETDGSVIGIAPAANQNDANYYIWTIVPSLKEITYTLTDNAGNSFSGTVNTTANINSVLAAINGIASCTIENENWSEDRTSVSATISYPFAASSKSKDNPVMISSFKGNASDFKWYADGTSIKAQKKTKAISTNVTNYLWTIYPSLVNNALTFTIKNLATGTYIHSTSSASTHDEGAVTLSDEASTLTLESDGKFKLATNTYLSLNSTTPTTPQIIGTWLKIHDGTKNDFQAVSYNLTIGTTRAATLYTPIAVTIPTGAQAKYVTTEGNSTAATSGQLMYQVKEEGSTIPAESAVIVIGDAGTYTFTAANGEAGELTGNLLFGYGKDTSVDNHAGTGQTGSVYALTAVDETAVFGHYIGTLYSAGKAYLDVAAIGAASVRYFSLFDDTETGIDNIQNNDESNNGAAYDLSGRRVQATAKGLYIINGKKVIK